MGVAYGGHMEDIDEVIQRLCHVEARDRTEYEDEVSDCTYTRSVVHFLFYAQRAA